MLHGVGVPEQPVCPVVWVHPMQLEQPYWEPQLAQSPPDGDPVQLPPPPSETHPRHRAQFETCPHWLQEPYMSEPVQLDGVVESEPLEESSPAAPSVPVSRGP